MSLYFNSQHISNRIYYLRLLLKWQWIKSIAAVLSKVYQHYDDQVTQYQHYEDTVTQQKKHA